MHHLPSRREDQMASSNRHSSQVPNWQQALVWKGGVASPSKQNAVHGSSSRAAWLELQWWWCPQQVGGWQGGGWWRPELVEGEGWGHWVGCGPWLQRRNGLTGMEVAMASGAGGIRPCGSAWHGSPSRPASLVVGIGVQRGWRVRHCGVHGSSGQVAGHAGTSGTWIRTKD